jgi:hypothetical protein
MNSKPIEEALDPDIRLSYPALKRAALRAREVAKATGTTVVVSRNGVIEHDDPAPLTPKTEGGLDLALRQPGSA